MNDRLATTADVVVGDTFTIHTGNLAGRTFTANRVVPGARAFQAASVDRPTLAAIWRDDSPVTIHEVTA